MIFVRHAHSLYTPEELTRPLSEQGLKDAGKVTELLRTVTVDHVISSPYQRAYQTVQGIAEHHAKEIEVRDEFKERTLSARPVDDFHGAMERVWSDVHYSFEGGESNTFAQLRGAEAALRILYEYKGKTVVIGTHGNLMVLIMNYFDPKYDFDFWKRLGVPDIYRLTFEGTELKEAVRLWK